MKVNKKSAPSSQTVQKNNFKKCSLKIKETLQNYNIFFIKKNMKCVIFTNIALFNLK